MSPKITFLYAYRPSGHSQAAAALRAQFKQLDPKIQTSQLELTSDLHPFLGPMITKAYLELIQKSPKLWDYLYDNQTFAQAMTEFKEELSLMHRRKMRDALKGRQPACIVCTHAIPCATLALEKEQGNLRTPLVAVPTDFGIHAYWISKHVDLYLAPTEEVRAELLRRGIESSRIQVTGIPIDPRFGNPPSKSQARKELGLDPDRFTALVSGGSKGIGPIRDIVSKLSTDLPDIQILVVCGANEGLFKWFTSRHGRETDVSEVAPRTFFDAPRIKAFPFIENMSTFLAAADISIGKPGGLSAGEAMSLGVPMIILAPLPGQEERNSKFLTAQGAALRVEDQQELAAAVRSLRLNPERLAEMKKSALRLGRPRSARAACGRILGLLERTFVEQEAGSC